MRHRLYYLIPDVESARATLDDLLINRIEQKHIHFLAKEPMPNDIPEATVFQKTDIVHGAELGMFIGAAMGFALGFALVIYYELSSEALIVVSTTLFGLLFGAWAASMIAASVPNSRLHSFFPEIEKGKVLLILDVPRSHIDRIEEMLAKRHPEMHFSGEESHIPVFP